jgi:hypothetical protein
MEKKKEAPWTSQKKMFKDGDPNVFRNFNWLTWKNMTEGERAMWTEFSEVQRAPIPKEVIDFQKKVKAANKPKEKVLMPDVFEDEDIDMETPDEIDQLKAELKDRGIYFHPNSKLETLQKKLDDADNSE